MISDDCQAARMGAKVKRVRRFEPIPSRVVPVIVLFDRQQNCGTIGGEFEGPLPTLERVYLIRPPIPRLHEPAHLRNKLGDEAPTGTQNSLFSLDPCPPEAAERSSF